MQAAPSVPPPRPTLPSPEDAPPTVFFRLDLSRGAPYSRSEYVRKALWRVVQRTVFRVARPRWRVKLLNMFGAQIHPTAHFRGTVKIHHPWLLRAGKYSSFGEHVQVYNLGPVVVGEHTSISQNVHLCAGTHDYKQPSMPLQRPPIVIGSGVWVCADAFIGPGVRVGHNSVVAARAAVVRDVPDATIVGGNPAAVVKARPLPEQSGEEAAEGASTTLNPDTRKD